MISPMGTSLVGGAIVAVLVACLGVSAHAKETGPSVICHFPVDESLGSLSWTETLYPQNGRVDWRPCGEAIGDVSVATGGVTRLWARDPRATDVQISRFFPSDVSVAIDFSWRRLRDVDLGAVVGSNSNVISIDVSMADITPQGLLWLGHLPCLQELRVRAMRPSNGLAQVLRLLPQLASLDLCGVDIGRGCQSELAGFRGLRRLELGSTHDLGDSDLAFLSNSTNLEYLGLTGTQVGDAGMANVGKLVHLRVLLLNQTRVTDVGMQHVAGLTALHTVTLPEGVSDAGLEAISRLTSISVLDLWSTGITDRGVSHLHRMPRLTELLLNGRRVNYASLAGLAGIVTLRKVTIAGPRLTPDDTGRLRRLFSERNIMLVLQ